MRKELLYVLTFLTVTTGQAALVQPAGGGRSAELEAYQALQSRQNEGGLQDAFSRLRLAPGDASARVSASEPGDVPPIDFWRDCALAEYRKPGNIRHLMKLVKDYGIPLAVCEDDTDLLYTDDGIEWPGCEKLVDRELALTMVAGNVKAFEERYTELRVPEEGQEQFFFSLRYVMLFHSLQRRPVLWKGKEKCYSSIKFIIKKDVFRKLIDAIRRDFVEGYKSVKKSRTYDVLNDIEILRTLGEFNDSDTNALISCIDRTFLILDRTVVGEDEGIRFNRFSLLVKAACGLFIEERDAQELSVGARASKLSEKDMSRKRGVFDASASRLSDKIQIGYDRQRKLIPGDYNESDALWVAVVMNHNVRPEKLEVLPGTEVLQNPEFWKKAPKRLYRKKNFLLLLKLLTKNLNQVTIQPYDERDADNLKLVFPSDRRYSFDAVLALALMSKNVKVFRERWCSKYKNSDFGVYYFLLLKSIKNAGDEFTKEVLNYIRGAIGDTIHRRVEWINGHPSDQSETVEFMYQRLVEIWDVVGVLPEGFREDLFVDISEEFDRYKGEARVRQSLKVAAYLVLIQSDQLQKLNDIAPAFRVGILTDLVSAYIGKRQKRKKQVMDKVERVCAAITKRQDDELEYNHLAAREIEAAKGDGFRDDDKRDGFRGDRKSDWQPGGKVELSGKNYKGPAGSQVEVASSEYDQ